MSSEVARSLRAGDSCLISGVIYTARDAAHGRLCAALEKGEALPVDLRGQTVFYAGPTPPPPGKPTGAIGPTTSVRMDAYTPRLLQYGVNALIGKGDRTRPVLDALMADELPEGCRAAANSPPPSESILIRGIHLVRCTSVMRSQLFRTRRGPKYFLYGVSGHSPVWGPQNTILGWYADEESVNAELAAIQEAMRRGKREYTLQYAVKVRHRFGRIEIIEKNP